MSNTRFEWSEYTLNPASSQNTATINKAIIRPRVTTKHTLPIAKVRKMVPATKFLRFDGSK